MLGGMHQLFGFVGDRVYAKIFVGETERSKKEKRKVEIIHVAIFKSRIISGNKIFTYLYLFKILTVKLRKRRKIRLRTPLTRLSTRQRKSFPRLKAMSLQQQVNLRFLLLPIG